MEMIAASRMRKAQERGLAGRPYSEKITQVIGALSTLPELNKYTLYLSAVSRRISILSLLLLTAAWLEG